MHGPTAAVISCTNCRNSSHKNPSTDQDSAHGYWQLVAPGDGESQFSVCSHRQSPSVLIQASPRAARGINSEC